MRYSYDRRYEAHYGTGTVIVPDQVATNQKEYATRDASFPALRGQRKIRVRIDAEATGLFTGGTGDLVVKSA